jgi:hypothetical protein
LTHNLTTKGGPVYQATYYNFTNGTGANYLYMRLSLLGYNASWINTTDGTMGLWLGIGFDTRTAFPANVVICNISFLGNGGDPQFKCFNGQGIGH